MYLLQNGGEVRTASMVADGDRRMKDDCAAVCGGDDCSDGCAETSQTSRGCHGKGRERKGSGPFCVLFGAALALL